MGIWFSELLSASCWSSVVHSLSWVHWNHIYSISGSMIALLWYHIGNSEKSSPFSFFSNFAFSIQVRWFFIWFRFRILATLFSKGCNPLHIQTPAHKVTSTEHNVKVSRLEICRVMQWKNKVSFYVQSLLWHKSSNTF